MDKTDILSICIRLKKTIIYKIIMASFTNLNELLVLNSVEIIKMLMLSLKYNNTVLNYDHPITLIFGKKIMNEVIRIVKKVFNILPTINTGIAVIYSFSTPENIKNTGPINNFTKLLQNEYSILLGENQNYKIIKIGKISSNYSNFKVRLINCFPKYFDFVLIRKPNSFWKINSALPILNPNI